MTKLSSALVAAAASTAVLAVGVSSASAATKLSGEIRFISNDIYVVPDRDLIASFEKKYPGVKVNLQSIPGGNAGIFSVLAPQLQANSAPDVITLFGGRGIDPSGIKLYEAGHLADLSKSPWVKRTPKLVKKLTTTRGKTFMTMIAAPTSGIHYDTQKFKALGLKIPRTWKEFLGLCRTIRQKSPSTIPVATGGVQLPFNAVNASMLAGSTVYAKDARWDGKRQRKQTTFAGTPAWRALFQRFVDMKNNNCLSPGAAADNSATAVSHLTSGRAVMMPAVSLFSANINAANPSGKYSNFPVPGDTAKQTRVTVYFNQGYAVNRRSKNLNAARAFVDFMSTPKQATRWASLNGQISVLDLGKKNPRLAPAFSQSKKLIAQGKSVGSPFVNWPTPTTFVELGRSVQTLYTGQASVNDVLAKMDASWGK